MKPGEILAHLAAEHEAVLERLGPWERLAFRAGQAHGHAQAQADLTSCHERIAALELSLIEAASHARGALKGAETLRECCQALRDVIAAAAQPAHAYPEGLTLALYENPEAIVHDEGRPDPRKFEI